MDDDGWVSIAPAPPCHHIWISKKVEQKGYKRRHTHECPKCGRIKVTVQPLRKRHE